ncbi:hypothetical protein DID88_009772 [Monilinia fructigena]|uniref:Uncharacterized protein n=1 Tax=Monilinia fructigena TaxID=38457 RepID=A0A395IJV3_9HELO|nr:hypothetical protein DID88_009772 [Monilinia fructigena]
MILISVFSAQGKGQGQGHTPPAETGPAPTATKEFVSINNVSASAEGASKATALATAVATAPQNAKRNGWSWGGGSGGYGGKYGASSSSSTSTSICTTSTTAAVATSSATASTTVAPPATTPYVSTPCATQPDGLRTKASITNYKCTLWGSGVDSASATNSGQWRDSFQVVITGSNGYEKEVTPPAQPGWQPPQQCGGGTKDTLTHLPAWDNLSSLCKFFNSYMLEKNGKPMGTYCSLFTQSYGSSQATYEPGQQGSDKWTCSRSYSYSLAN